MVPVLRTNLRTDPVPRASHPSHRANLRGVGLVPQASFRTNLPSRLRPPPTHQTIIRTNLPNRPRPPSPNQHRPAGNLWANSSMPCTSIPPKTQADIRFSCRQIVRVKSQYLYVSICTGEPFCELVVSGMPSRRIEYCMGTQIISPTNAPYVLDKHQSCCSPGGCVGLMRVRLNRV